MSALAPIDANPCQSCGACCGYSENWPRFTIEDDSALDAIPAALVNARQSGMRCEADRCAALSGTIGQATACTIYALRPEVCRDCQPGDPECAMARRKFRLPPLPTTLAEDEADQWAASGPSPSPSSNSDS
ncbi:YkgJ family cysteine cluster protein [Rhodopseudomonas sp. BR0M22]|uniref:YkgJ family cysteine cluster protein n=1 Tax=Rhodopseudomonas sp. BR0M22 TaxID=2269369 RepID=UPI0013DEADBE|nr:YkgJ family cysteine cluster protein [Rhodopseudomonas sp. BR0M22]NEW94003.1 YkgJ family cysteine cluster protein [Rhodopseudomonas sp. BR0M22]